MNKTDGRHFNEDDNWHLWKISEILLAVHWHILIHKMTPHRLRFKQSI